MFKQQDLYTDTGKVYAVFTRSGGFMARLIRYFSKRISGLEEYDHCVLVSGGVEYHATNPRIEARLFRRRKYNAIYEVTVDDPESVLKEAHRFLERQDKYGYVQLVSMLLSHYVGWHPVQAGQVCSEFLARCIYLRREPWMERYTVGQTMNRMIIEGKIKFLDVLKK